jgi:hypothetical protein
MKLPRAMNLWITTALLASTCLVTIAPAALADRGGRRYKGVDRGGWVRNDRHVSRVVVRDSGAGPVLAGLIGGFLLGASVARAEPVVVHEHVCAPAPRYRYWDPYCGEWFISLTQYREHTWDARHPRVVKVFDERGGDCVRTLHWSDGAWYDGDDRDWDD